MPVSLAKPLSSFRVEHPDGAVLLVRTDGATRVDRVRDAGSALDGAYVITVLAPRFRYTFGVMDDFGDLQPAGLSTCASLAAKQVERFNAIFGR